MTQSKTNKLYVIATTAAGDRLIAGKLICDYENRTVTFLYSPKYIEHPDAFPIDPSNFPLGRTPYSAPITRFSSGIPGVLEDNGPDTFGKKVIRELYKDKDYIPITEAEFLVAGSGFSVGNLEYTNDITDITPKKVFRPFTDIEEIIAVAADIDDGRDVHPSKEIFLNTFKYSCGTPGARPKALIDDEGMHYLVKFPSHTDAVDMCALEHATMTMAREAGINTAETQLVNTKKGNILLVKRFDLDENGSRKHLISLCSLAFGQKLNLAEMDKVRYSAILKNAKNIGDPDTVDTKVIAKEVFTRMLLNIATGNTDDHAHNHAYIKNDSDNYYTLSPAYDIVPTIGTPAGSSHAIPLTFSSAVPTKDNILFAAKEMKLTDADCREITDRVLSATENWKEKLKELGFSDKHLKIVAPNFDGTERVKLFANMITEKTGPSKTVNLPER